MKLLINIICAMFPNRRTRRMVRTRLMLFFYSGRMNRTWKKYPNLADKFVISTNGGLADQFTELFAMLELKKNRCKVVFNMAGLKTNLPVSDRLYEFSEIENMFGNLSREIVDGLARTPFELHKYKIDWNGILFANLPREIKDNCNMIGIALSEIDDRTKRFAPLYLDGVGAIPAKSGLLAKYKKFLENVEIAYKLDRKNFKKLSEIRGVKNSICVHIRRGDYINFWGGKTVSAEYFHNAIADVVKRAKWKSATCFVFSDDWKWARDAVDYSVPGADVSVDFVAINKIDDPQSELELMRACKHFVASVGFFGRLAYAMCDNRDKKLIAPSDDDFVTVSVEK